MSLTDLIPRTPSITSSKASLLFDFDVNDPDFGSLKDLPTSCSAAFKLVDECSLRKVKTCPVALGELSERNEDLLYQIGSSSSQRSRCGSINTTSSHDELNVQGNQVTLEDLRMQFNSCFSCGVSWHENHISLDCVECGGYTFDRPCPSCDGKCGASWKRDTASSHCLGKASWIGACELVASAERGEDKAKSGTNLNKTST